MPRKPGKKSDSIYNQISSDCSNKTFSQDYYDVLETFNKIAARYPLLKKDEERAMIQAYSEDRSTLNKMLFYHNIRIVLNLSKKYLKTVDSPADLLMNGARGLMIAAERFDINKGIKFNTYATRWVFKYLLMFFYSKSPITGINQTSLNLPFFGGAGADESAEQIDFLNTGVSDEISTSFTGAGASFLNSIDYTHFEKPSIPSPSKEYEEVSNTRMINDVIDEISADPHFNEIDRDIIYNNMMENNYSISAIAQKHHVPAKEVNKRKRKIISNFKNVLSDKYNINSIEDVI